MFTGKRWRAQLADLTQTMTHANELAMQMINDTAPDAFAYNANWASFELERVLNANMGFGLYDRQTVKRLIADTPTLLPPSRVDIPRDKRWNMQKITDQITQGIIQGEALDAVAKRLQTVAVMNFNSARTHARTAMTGAQNAGRIESYHRAEKMGIKVKKRWLCTLDNHTRHAHAALDGQVRDVDTPFDSELGQIMFPGDRDAAPANVYNCRCTLISVLPDYPAENAQRRDMDPERKPIKDMTFAEWAGWKNEGKQGKSVEIKGKSGIINVNGKQERIKVPVSGMAIPDKQFGKKAGKHMEEYGLNPVNRSDREQFLKIVREMQENAEEIRCGGWRGQKEACLFFIIGDDVLITTKENVFVTQMKGGVNNARVKNAGRIEF